MKGAPVSEFRDQRKWVGNHREPYRRDRLSIKIERAFLVQSA
jgi:hypothetical protein